MAELGLIPAGPTQPKPRLESLPPELQIHILHSLLDQFTSLAKSQQAGFTFSLVCSSFRLAYLLSRAPHQAGLSSVKQAAKLTARLTGPNPISLRKLEVTGFEDKNRAVSELVVASCDSLVEVELVATEGEFKRSLQRNLANTISKLSNLERFKLNGNYTQLDVKQAAR